MTETKEELGFNRETELKSAVLVLKKMERRLIAERFRSYEDDPDFLKYLRGYSQLLQTANTIARDAELADLEKRLEDLEAAAEAHTAEE